MGGFKIGLTWGFQAGKKGDLIEGTGGFQVENRGISGKEQGDFKEVTRGFERGQGISGWNGEISG
jgi:hypothetical protein